MGKRKFVGSKLNPKGDSDIIEMLDNMDTANISKLVRKGLRIVLGLEGESQVKQVKKEEPVEQKEKPPVKKPMVWNLPK